MPEYLRFRDIRHAVESIHQIGETLYVVCKDGRVYREEGFWLNRYYPVAKDEIPKKLGGYVQLLMLKMDGEEA